MKIIFGRFFLAVRRVAASSAAWGWLSPTIPKACGFEAATQPVTKPSDFRNSLLVRFFIVNSYAKPGENYSRFPFNT
jgi:hypothetical protein